MSRLQLLLALDNTHARLLGADPTPATFDDLAPYLRGQRVWLVVPAEHLTLVAAKIPGGRGSWQKALPYAVEDQLAEDVDSLHFAFRPTPLDDGRVAAVAVRRDLLTAWIDGCRNAGIAVQAIVPEPLLLPETDSDWTALCDHERVVVRAGPWRTFVSTTAELPEWLGLAMDAEEHPPTGLRLWGDPVPPLPAPTLSHEGDVIDWIEQIRALPRPPLELQQGGFARSASVGRWVRPWIAAAVIAGLWITAQTVGTVLHVNSLAAERVRLQGAINRVYEDAFPGARVVDARAQMEGKLRELGNGEQGGFLDLLAGAARRVQGLAEPKPTVTGLRFAGNRLELILQGGALDALEGLRAAHPEDPLPLAVDVRSSVRDNEVESQLIVQETRS